MFRYICIYLKSIFSYGYLKLFNALKKFEIEINKKHELNLKKVKEQVSWNEEYIRLEKRYFYDYFKLVPISENDYFKYNKIANDPRVLVKPFIRKKGLPSEHLINKHYEKQSKKIRDFKDFMEEDSKQRFVMELVFLILKLLISKG